MKKQLQVNRQRIDISKCHDYYELLISNFTLHELVIIVTIIC